MNGDKITIEELLEISKGCREETYDCQHCMFDNFKQCKKALENTLRLYIDSKCKCQRRGNKV